MSTSSSVFAARVDGVQESLGGILNDPSRYQRTENRTTGIYFISG